jgi:hypothetical protein
LARKIAGEFNEREAMERIKRGTFQKLSIYFSNSPSYASFVVFEH